MIHPDPIMHAEPDPKAEAALLRALYDGAIIIVLAIAAGCFVLALARPAEVMLPTRDWTCAKFGQSTVPIQTDQGVGHEVVYDCVQWSRK